MWRPKYVSYHFIPFFLKILFKSQILTSIISFDHPNEEFCFYGVIFVKYIGKIDTFGHSKIKKIQKLEIYWLHFFQNGVQIAAQIWCDVNPSGVFGFCWVRKSKWSKIAVHMCQIYKLKLPNEVVPALSWEFSHHKNPKNKNGLTSLHLATFLSEFYTCQNAAVLWSGVSVWIDSTSFGCFS